MYRRLVLIQAVLGLLALAPFAAETSANHYRSYGKPGASTTFVGLCRYHDAWGTITLTTRPPLIYGRSYVRGRREWQWVRWRGTVGNRLTGEWWRTDWSEWRRAWDYRGGHARFETPKGITGLQTRDPHSYVMDVRIDWWRSGKRVGTKLHHIRPYKYSFGGGWSGDYDACGYIGGFNG
jgi:hypothetical protein